MLRRFAGGLRGTRRRVLVIGVLALVVLLVAAELVTRAVLTGRVVEGLRGLADGDAADHGGGAALVTELTAADPAVHLGPWPVLPGLLVGRLPAMTVSAHDLPWRGVAVDVDVRLSGLRRGETPANADLHVRLSVPAAGLSSLQPGAQTGDDTGPLARATWSVRDDLLVASTVIERPRRSVPVDLSVAVSAVDGSVHLEPVAVTVAGMVLDVGTVAGLGGGMAEAVRPRDLTPELPHGLVLTGARVAGDGLVLDAESPPR